MSPVIYSTRNQNNCSLSPYCSLKFFSAHREVDKGEDIKLYQYRETQENSIKKQHVDA